ncbi:MAG: GTP-binding protein [Evtepia sp.]|uniref:TIGR03943 family putative permease subunit n=1 Tax=Evtepia sp. TaxID=2773933 RepID=UPI002A7579BE|nr:GTP-binding protein [Evtepia sp.]MDY3015451.1 GTP-binding protein [Evtepia sp.]
MMMEEIPVYLFTGFLDAGKTKFIQETMEDVRFNSGENTLLLLCEEGEEEYDPSAFSGHNVFIEVVEDQSELTAKNLERLQKKHAAERVVVEYNGMWMLDDLYQNMPDAWIVYQEFMFADSQTFLTYNANMRGLVVDKLKSCEMVVLNRADDKVDRVEIHKIIRAVSRRTNIAYETREGEVFYDDTPEEMPFDLDAPIVEIQPQDFAVWYQDLSEEPDKYKGKTVRVGGFTMVRDKLPAGSFIFGRRIMTCCVDDITFAGLLCTGYDVKKLQDQQWVELTAKIAIKNNRVYNKKGPVLSVVSIQPGTAPEQDVATFY